MLPFESTCWLPFSVVCQGTSCSYLFLLLGGWGALYVGDCMDIRI